MNDNNKLPQKPEKSAPKIACADRRPQLSEEAFVAIADRFRALAEPLRLQILYHLGDGERTVGNLVELTGGSQPNVSRHLSSLHSSGLVRRRRQGTSVYYSIADATIFDLCEQVCGGIERTLEERSRAMK